MAAPSDVTLTIAVTSGFLTSRVTVEYRATFTETEVAGNLGFVETIRLFGEDPPPGDAGDDLLFGADQDEIYARVCLRRFPGDPNCADSRIVSV